MLSAGHGDAQQEDVEGLQEDVEGLHKQELEFREKV